ESWRITARTHDAPVRGDFRHPAPRHAPRKARAPGRASRILMRGRSGLLKAVPRSLPGTGTAGAPNPILSRPRPTDARIPARTVNVRRQG
ncbi:MAG: hypothetical protein LBR80_09425, partial [Deltaproteobacteria bacterium]|nr:hypothetical protein [Deltaproteobacteria bacterium]